MKNEHLPFRPPDRYVNESGNRFVDGYTKQLFVKKEFKPASGIRFESVEHVKRAIVLEKRRRDLARKIMLSNGIQEIQIPRSDYAIHTSSSGEPTYSEFQEWYSGSKNLSEFGLSLLRLPPDTLNQLEHFFRVAGVFAKTKGNVIDIVGSSVKKVSFTTRAKSCLLPLFYAENIVIDSEGTVRYIDVNAYENISGEKLTTRYARSFGHYLSKMVLKTAIFLNRPD